MTDIAFAKANASQQLQMSLAGVWQYDRRQDFTGGENRLLTPDFVAPNQVILAVNCQITPEGVLQTRKGLSAMNASLGDGGIISAFRYKKEDGSSYLLVQHGTQLLKATYTGAGTTGAFTVVKNGLSANKLRGVVWKDVLLLTNGVQNPFYFDGGTDCSDIPGDPPISKLIAVYGGRLWFVPVATPNVLQCSELENYGAYDPLDAIKVRDGDGDTITALAPLAGGLAIFKSNSVWGLFGTSRDDWRLTTSPIADNVGCYGMDGLCAQPQIFMAKNGFYSFDLSSVTRLPKTHDAILDTMTDAQKQGVIACHLAKENRALFIFPDSNNTALNLDLNYGCITSWNGLNAKSIIAADAAGDVQAFIIGDASKGVLNLLNSDDDDNGTPIVTQIWTAYTDCGSIRDKVFRLFKPEFAPVKNLSSTVILYYDVDYSMLGGFMMLEKTLNAPLTWDSTNWDSNNWAPAPRGNDPFWIPNIRGLRISCGIQATGRIKLLGYVTKYREVGNI